MTEEYSQDIMSAFFSRKVGLEERNLIKAELGYGKGIGQKDGSYSLYTKKVASLAGEENPVSYIGRDVEETEYGINIVDPRYEFEESDTPIVLVKFFNLMYETEIRLHWTGGGLDYWSYYSIPAATSMRYDWWNEYGAYFLAPEGLVSGEYAVEIRISELRKKDIMNLVDEIQFTIL